MNTQQTHLNHQSPYSNIQRSERSSVCSIISELQQFTFLNITKLERLLT